MSFTATLKGVVAQVIGGMGNVPGAIFGSLAARPHRKLRRRAVRLELPQPVRLRPAAADAGVAPQRAVRRARRPARTDDRHLPGPEPPGSRAALADLGLRRRRRCCRWSPTSLPAADPHQRLALRHAGPQPHPGRRHASARSRSARPALLAIGAYASALLALDLGWPVVVTVPPPASSRRCSAPPCCSPPSGCAATTSPSRRWRSARSSAS